MEQSLQTMNPKELEEAFTLFTEASRQLSNAYAELQHDVASLTEQLAVANGHLKKQYEEKAVLSRRLSLLLEKLPAGVLEVNAAGEIVSCNQRGFELLGAVALGSKWQNVLSDRLKLVESDVWQFGEVGESGYVRIEQVQVPEEGVELVLLHDVTTTIQMRVELERQGRLAAMGQMAAGLAHQLRTPLAAALLYTGHLQRPELRDEDRLKFAAKTNERLGRLEVLVQNMLQFVRGTPQQISTVNLVDVIHEAVSEVRSIYEPKGVRLTTDVPQLFAMVAANHKELSGAIMNLLENACQASVVDGEVLCRLIGSDASWQLEVVDYGEGIAADVLPRLFEPFFTTKKGGTGLGLAIVRNMVKAYGGEVTVTSAPKMGSNFKICLPRLPDGTNVLEQD
ncbi:sensor histidine kinase [Chitinibacter tainanensis]|uniref:sensor histidine kinase n=1 Tax=Chitinibacter tainanensis TaxID=230667 RepID=UPI000409B07B|nr:HAMP domain-containing sensor histidine kinase [Chitinibacter tainanensis]